MTDSAALDLSVVVITLNEEVDLPGCLDSVQDLNAEIVVVDNHSADRTLEIARRYTSNVHTRAFNGFAAQKQFAIEKASRNWILSLDADERLTPELAREIKALLVGTPVAAGYEIPFEVYSLGRKLRFGGFGSERHLRLFRKDSGRFSGDVHEGFTLAGPVGKLSGKIQHFPYRDLDEHLDKLNRYTTMAARAGLVQGRRITPFHHLLPPWVFFVRYVLRLGFLDGRAGLMQAVMAAFTSWAKYIKLARLQDRKGS